MNNSANFSSAFSKTGHCPTFYDTRAIVLWSAVLTLFIATTLAAQEKGEVPIANSTTLEPIIVTASREPQPLELSPGAIYVIPRAEIERKRYANVLETLREIPGVHVDQPGARGSRSSIYTRGLDPNHTLVLIDGVRVNDPTNNRGGSFDLSTLGVDNIDRIEVVRGPLSAVYGSDAIAGAINIITRKGGKPAEVQLDLSGGRFGYVRAMGGAWGSAGGVDYSFTGSFNNEGDLPNESAFSGWHIKTALGLPLSADSGLRGTLRFTETRNKAFPDDSGGPDFAVIRSLENRDIREFSTGLELTGNPIEWLGYSLSTSYYRRREADDSPGIAPGLRDPFGIPAQSTRDLLDRYSIALGATTKMPHNISFSAGGDFYWERGSSDSELFSDGAAVPASFKLDRVVGGPFVEGFWNCPCGLVFQAGVRSDFPDDASSRITPRVSASYRIPQTLAVLNANWGRGFKLPSFFSLANPIVGNPDLRAETSRGFDVGVRYNAWRRRLTMGITYFDVSVKDLIDFEQGPPPRLVNRSHVVSRGVEAGLQIEPLSSLVLKSHLTYNHTDIHGSSEELLNRPRWRGGFSLAWGSLEKVLFTIRGLFVGNVLDSSVPTGQVNLSPYQRFDVALSWRFDKSTTLYLAVDNVFNAKYEEAIGFPSVGIRPRIGLNLKM
jgi:outer membrane cobalamin receptor